MNSTAFTKLHLYGSSKAELKKSPDSHCSRASLYPASPRTFQKVSKFTLDQQTLKSLLQRLLRLAGTPTFSTAGQHLIIYFLKSSGRKPAWATESRRKSC